MSSQKLPSRVDLDQLLDLVDVARLAVRRHAHHLVLALVDLEAEEGGEGAVEQAERVREADLRSSVISVPRPTPMVAVVHSPTPSTVRIAASSNGEQKNVLAACDR